MMEGNQGKVKRDGRGGEVSVEWWVDGWMDGFGVGGSELMKEIEERHDGENEGGTG